MAGNRVRRRIPEATVARLPVYLRILSDQLEQAVVTMSSEDLAELAGCQPAGVLCELMNPDGSMAKGAQIGRASCRERVFGYV